MKLKDLKYDDCFQKAQSDGTFSDTTVYWLVPLSDDFSTGLDYYETVVNMKTRELEKIGVSVEVMLVPYKAVLRQR